MIGENNNRLGVPKGWQWAKLDDLAGIILGQSPPSSTYNEAGDGLPFFQGKLEFGSIYPTTRKWCRLPKKIAEKGDVLVSVRAPVGPTNICPVKACIGRGLAAIRPQAGVQSLFLLYLMRAFENELSGRGTGTTFGAITGDQLKEFDVPLPPLHEQHRIVAKIEELFSDLGAGAEALKRVKANLKRYRQAVFKAAFEGKLTAKWRDEHKGELEPASVLLERIKEERKQKAKGRIKELPPVDTSNLPELPEEWVWSRVGEVCNLIQYGSSDRANGGPTGIPVLRMGNILDGKLSFDDLKYFPNDWPEIEVFLLKDGDVLFNRTNSAELVGKSAVYKVNHPRAAFASYLIRISANREIYDPDILSYFINSFFGRQYIGSVVSQQVGQANVNGTKLAQMPIPLPPTKELRPLLQEIDSRLSVAEGMVQTVSFSLKRAERLRQSVLKTAFEGKLVPQDPTDEPASVLLERIKQEKTKITVGNQRLPKGKSTKSQGVVK